MRPRRAHAALAAALALAGCASLPDSQPLVEPADGVAILFDVATVLDDGWQQQVLNGRTQYRVTAIDGRAAIAATGRNSASGLIRKVDTDLTRCATVKWSWRVDQVQSRADLRVKDGDDVAASIFLLFGDPGFLFDPVRVPTLRYAWTGDQQTVGEVIDSPYLPGTLKTIVIRTGTAEAGRWLTEQRDLLADYRLAFGRQPDDDVFAIVLFTDNDQTSQPALAYYERVSLDCSS